MDNLIFIQKINQLLENANDRQWSLMIDKWISQFEYVGSKYKQLNNLKKSNINKSSEIRGVSWDKRNNKWRSRYWNGHRQVSLGLYDTPELAKEAIDEYVRMSDSTTP